MIKFNKIQEKMLKIQVKLPIEKKIPKRPLLNVDY